MIWNPSDFYLSLRADEVIESLKDESPLDLSKSEGISENISRDLIGGVCIKVNCQTGQKPVAVFCFLFCCSSLSGAAERAFSILSTSFTDQQRSYLEAKYRYIMQQYNFNSQFMATLLMTLLCKLY